MVVNMSSELRQRKVGDDLVKLKENQVEPTSVTHSEEINDAIGDAAQENNATLWYNKPLSRTDRGLLHVKASILFIWFTTWNGLVLLMRVLKQLLGNGAAQKQLRKGRIAPHYLDFATMPEADVIRRVRELAALDEPVILQNMPNEFFEVLQTTTDFNLPEDFPGQRKSGAYLIMDSYFFPALGEKLLTLIKSCLSFGAVFMGRFQGGYKTCVAHIDSGSMFNFYYVRRGAKQVTLVPPEYSTELPLTPGSDSVYVKGSGEADYETFGHQYTGHYYFKVSAGEVLIFNNCAMLHQFTNLTGEEEIYSIRTQAWFSAHSAVLWNDMCNYKNAHHMAQEASVTRTVREILFMA